ncbi:RNA polymerase sigma factor [Pedobacter sp.]|jgi:RNA polymerase sigma-70 factor (family 1)|uniref:RNA polymerase sigma factor n=1 Tax=Pedobacter sp. TaxID=1411316 RepID=UPI001E46B945|nr:MULTISPECIES: RNA polymerase sigma-70 factor [unclassified Pedobacter]HWW39361.1 RNA polymerase sigma-70 factor [Pedobacter sp.]
MEKEKWYPFGPPMQTNQKPVERQEETLLLHLQQGKETAFTEIYDQYSKPLFLKILRMTGDTEVAKELLQDLFLKLWEHRHLIDPSLSFKSYLYTIGVNLVYDYFRKEAKNKQLSAHLLAMAVDADVQTDELLISKENINMVRKAIDQLSPQRKKVYMLCKLEGKSYQEVSAELQISTSTIHDHIVKANSSIKKYLLNHPDFAVYALIAGVLMKGM